MTTIRDTDSRRAAVTATISRAAKECYGCDRGPGDCSECARVLSQYVDALLCALVPTGPLASPRDQLAAQIGAWHDCLIELNGVQTTCETCEIVAGVLTVAYSQEPAA